MTLDNLIERLQAIKEEHGGDLEIIDYKHDEFISEVEVSKCVKTIDWGSGRVVRMDTCDLDDKYELKYEERHNNFKDDKKHIVVVGKCVTIY